MGKGGKGEAAAGEGENMAAWLVAKNTLKIMPFKLPPLGLFVSCRLSRSFVDVSLPSKSTGSALGRSLVLSVANS